MHTIHQLGRTERKEGPIRNRVTINKREVEMEIDTVASVSIISEATFRRLWSHKEAPGLIKTTTHHTMYVYWRATQDTGRNGGMSEMRRTNSQATGSA